MTEQNLKHPCDRIRAERKALSLTQKALADLCGAEQASVSQWEKGTLPSGEHLNTLCEALNVSPQWLLRGEEPKRPTEPDDPLSGLAHDIRRDLAAIGKRAAGGSKEFRQILSSLARLARKP